MPVRININEGGVCMHQWSSRFKKYLYNDLTNDTLKYYEAYSKTTRLVIGAMLATLAAIFQSAGVFSGIGYTLSVLTTLPIVVSTIISIKNGLLTYLLTIFLLTIIQPSELFVFPFTTGLLGLSLGIGLRYFKNRLVVVSIGSLSLSVGILILLYGIKFPILGPAVSSTIDGVIMLYIVLFTFFYSLIWMLISTYGLGMMNKVFLRRTSSELCGEKITKN